MPAMTDETPTVSHMTELAVTLFVLKDAFWSALVPDQYSHLLP